MSRRFTAKTSRVPIADVGVSVERFECQNAEIRIADSGIQIGAAIILYRSIVSAELQSSGFWRFREYALHIATTTEIYSLRIPRSEVEKGFPFTCERTKLDLIEKKELRRQLALLVALIILAFISEWRK